jgi:aminoglycoside phosphotransferase (APT) family kinase protein
VNVQAPELQQAMAAAIGVATSQGLAVDDAVVIHNSNKLTLRLLPADVAARVAPLAHQNARFELELAQRLAAAGSPVAALDPRVRPDVYRQDGFDVTLWTYYEQQGAPEDSPAAYADALARLHGGMRTLDIPSRRFTDRVDDALLIVSDRDGSPTLGDEVRELLHHTLADQRRAVSEHGGEQLLHGEPHPGNLISTRDGLLFIDFETTCRGPVEFDLAHSPPDVAAYYPGADHDILRHCRILVLAMIVAWRWDPADQLPNGRQRGDEWLSQLRVELDDPGQADHRS